MLEVPDDPLFLSPGMMGTGGSTEQPLAGSYKSVRRFNLYIFYLVTLPCKCPYYRLKEDKVSLPSLYIIIKSNIA